ncbi:MAG: hypothetical protein HY540_07805 [Deltaproteobacteria bacterium]|nr:hypothetical protein [Deltaproteobacteria bacterium]
MTTKVSITSITPDDSLRDEFRLYADANRDGFLEPSEVADADGYLKCEYHLSDRQFLRWQAAFLPHGLIWNVYPGYKCQKPDTSKDFSYVQVRKVRGEPHVYAYFAHREEAEAYVKANMPRAKITKVSARNVERFEGMPRESTAFREQLPGHQVDDANRPESTQGKVLFYYEIDIIPNLPLRRESLDLINAPGVNGCYAYALYAVGAAVALGYVTNENFLDDVRQFFQPAAEIKPGTMSFISMGVIRDGKETLSPRHAFVELGNGWVLTKNGESDEVPFRVQRRNAMLMQYLRVLDRRSIMEYAAKAGSKSAESATYEKCASGLISYAGCPAFPKLTESRTELRSGVANLRKKQH